MQWYRMQDSVRGRERRTGNPVADKLGPHHQVRRFLRCFESIDLSRQQYFPTCLRYVRISAYHTCTQRVGTFLAMGALQWCCLPFCVCSYSIFSESISNLSFGCLGACLVELTRDARCFSAYPACTQQALPIWALLETPMTGICVYVVVHSNHKIVLLLWLSLVSMLPESVCVLMLILLSTYLASACLLSLCGFRTGIERANVPTSPRLPFFFVRVCLSYWHRAR